MTSEPATSAPGYLYHCEGEISSFDDRCGALMTQEDCEAEGVNVFSDGVCDWVMDEQDGSTMDPATEEPATSQPMTSEPATSAPGYLYHCEGEISSFDDRCGALMTQEDCEAEGVNVFSDG